ncbi:MAG: beta-ketoacyl-ACP synthase III [Maricaulaceae bacterium]|nr:beta-ketoacyl-ACP synthase III [Maricaulaceae bacterium]
MIRGTAWHAPETSISNAELVASYNAYVARWNAINADRIAAGELQALLPSSEDFIKSASGIEHRRVLDKAGVLDPDRLRPHFPRRPKEQASVQAEFGLKAVEKLLDKTGYDPKDIDGLIFACSAPQRYFPAVGIEIQAAIGMGGWAYDMQMACASALFALQQAKGMIDSGAADAILIVDPEIMTGINDHRKRDVHFIFGDCASAMLVERADRGPGGWRVIGTRNETRFSNALRSDFGFLNPAERAGGEPYEPGLEQDGHRVFKDVIPFAAGVSRALIDTHGVTPAQVRRMWLHQANIRIIEMVAKRVLERERTEDNAPAILKTYGNTSSSSVVMTFDLNSADMAAGEKGVMCAFGAGYGCGAALVEKRA